MIQQSLGLVQAIYLSPLLLVKRTNDNPLVLVCSLPFRIIFNLFPRKFALRYQSDHKSKGSPNKAIKFDQWLKFPPIWFTWLWGWATLSASFSASIYRCYVKWPSMVFSVFSCTDFLQSLSQLKVVCHYVTCTSTYTYKSQCYSKNHSVSLYSVPVLSGNCINTFFLHLNNVFWIVRLAKFAFSSYERHKLVELSLESRINCRFANNIWDSEKTINRYICLPCQVIK